MDLRLRTVHRRDAQLLLLVGATLGCIAGHLAETLGAAADAGGGWRRIDFSAVQSRLRSGDLATHEALWYRAGPAEDAP